MAGPRGEVTAGPGLQASIPNKRHRPSPNSDTNYIVILSAKTLCLFTLRISLQMKHFSNPIEC
jgi:hypothetical protein